MDGPILQPDAMVLVHKSKLPHESPGQDQGVAPIGRGVWPASSLLEFSGSSSARGRKSRLPRGGRTSSRKARGVASHKGPFHLSLTLVFKTGYWSFPALSELKDFLKLFPPYIPYSSLFSALALASLFVSSFVLSFPIPAPVILKNHKPKPPLLLLSLSLNSS